MSPLRRTIVGTHADTRFVHAWLTGFGGLTADLELVFRVETDQAERMMEVRHKVVLALLEQVKGLGLQLNAPWAA